MARSNKHSLYIVMIGILLLVVTVMTNSGLGQKSHALASGSNVIQIRGSDTVVPFMQLASESYMAEKPQTVVVNGGGTSHGIKSIIDDTSDIGMASSAISEELTRMMKDNKFAMKPFLVGRDALAVFVHPDNPVSNLTLEQVRQIYRGDIRNWEQLGGPDLEIEVTSHDPSQGTYEVWREKVMGMTSFLTKQTKILSSSAMQPYVASHKGAIGYISTLSLGKTVKVLSLGGVKPEKDSIRSGTYPISRDLTLYVREDRIELTKEFMAFLLDPQKGQGIAQSLGIIPVQ
jgi:phosphate transport system substrate-binding protein